MRATLTWTDANEVEHIRHVPQDGDDLVFGADDIDAAAGSIVTVTSDRYEGRSARFAVSRLPDGSTLIVEV